MDYVDLYEASEYDLNDFTIMKLTGILDWQVFKMDVTMALRVGGLQHHIETTRYSPSGVILGVQPGLDFAAFARSDQFVWAFIYFTMSPVLKIQYGIHESAITLWRALCSKYDDKEAALHVT